MEAQLPVTNVYDKIEMAKLRKKEADKKYYDTHKFANHRAAVLLAVKHKGRVPKLQSIQKYNIEIQELVDKWREFCATKNREDIRPLKIMKFQALLLNMV